MGRPFLVASQTASGTSGTGGEENLLALGDEAFLGAVDHGGAGQDVVAVDTCGAEC
jgi:hypothetical protein